MSTSRWDSTLPTAVAIALGVSAPAIVWMFARPLAILILAITVAEALSPIVEHFQRRMPRGLAIAVVYAVLAGILLAMAWLIVPTLVAEGRQLTQAAPTLWSRAQGWLKTWDQRRGARRAISCPLAFETWPAASRPCR